MKKSILMIMGLMMGIWAGAAYRSVDLKLKDESHMVISMHSPMQIGVVADSLTLTSSMGYVTLPLSDVSHWRFTSAEGTDEYWSAGINDALSDAISMVVDGDAIVLRNLKAGCQVMLYDIQGRAIANAQAQADGTCEIQLSAVKSRIVVLVANGQTYKIALK